MANRLRGNVFIIDSSEGAAPLEIPAQAKLLGVGFWASGTNASMIITIGNTTDTLIRYNYQIVTVATNNGVVMEPAWQYTYLGGFYVADTLRAGTVTSGTGYLYFA